MKRIIIVLYCFLFSVSISANSYIPYEKANTEGLIWVMDSVFSDGIKYTGYINSKGERTLIGSARIMSDKKHWKTRINGQIKNNLTDGFIHFEDYSSSTTYYGLTKAGAFNGFGKLSIQGYDLVTEFDNNNPVGLAFRNEGGYYKAVIYKKGVSETKPAYDVLKQSMYQNSKANIKELCEKNNVRFVEDMSLSGGITYSGGWKNGEPFYYGTYYEYDFVKKGCIEYKNGEINVIAPFEEFSKSSRHPYYRKLEVINGDTSYYHLEPSFAQRFVMHKDGTYESFEFISFNNFYIQLLGSVNGKMWAYQAFPNAIVEGYLEIGENITVSQEKLVASEGEIVYKRSDASVHHFPNGDSLIVVYEEDGNEFGKYVYANGEYSIGVFRKGEMRAGTAYFADGELKQKVVDTYNPGWWQRRADKAHDFFASPKEGFHAFTYSDGATYEGEWANHQPHGKGKKVYRHDNVETIEDGRWEKGILVEGYSYDLQIEGPKKGSYSGKYVYSDGFKRISKVYCKTVEKTQESIRYMKNPNNLLITTCDLDDKEFIFVAQPEKFIIDFENGNHFVGKFEIYSARRGEELIIKQIDSCYYNYKEGNFTACNIQLDTLGKGTYVDMAQNKIEGSFIFNLTRLVQPQGHAEVKYADGSKYSGEMCGGKRNQKGVLEFANGDRISAVWKNDQISEEHEIVYNWADGRQFIGVIQNGKWQGKYLDSNNEEVVKKKIIKTWTIIYPTMTISMP